jgi:O-antigen/teichoic acid export membrane protein
MKRSDLPNLVALATIQVANALMPLFVFPYTLSVVGAGPYAQLALTEAIMFAVLALVLYSFEVDGVARVVSLDWRREPEVLSEVFTTVLFARLLIFVACVGLALLAQTVVEPLTGKMILIWLMVPLSYVLQSTWLFQAIERNIVIAALTVGSRLTAAIFLIVWVSEPEDVWLVPAILGLCSLASAIASLVYAHVALGVYIRRITINELKKYLRHGWPVFVGNMAVILYRDFNVVILGATQNNAEMVAAYSIAEKLIKALQATMRPLNQIYFPKTLRELGCGRNADASSFCTVLAHTYPQWMALTAVILMAGAVYIVGREHSEVIHLEAAHWKTVALLMPMLLAPYFGIANFMFGTAGLNQLGKRTYFYRAILATGVVSVIACGLLSAVIGAMGAAISFVLAEFMLFVAITYAYNLPLLFVKRSCD